MWNKISNSEDAICFEKNKQDISVRLEARYEGDRWIVYRGFYTSDRRNYTEEYSAQTREEAEKMIKNLKSEKDITLGQLNELIKKKNRKLGVEFRRAFREESVEKWNFSINEGKYDNFFIVKEADSLEIDIVLDENYKSRKDEIIERINNLLSVSEGADYNVYFFTRNEKISESVPDYEVELGFR
ncbi:MAG: hypothetical protein ACQEP1_03470 [Nanobdellota archaeon]